MAFAALIFQMVLQLLLQRLAVLSARLTHHAWHMFGRQTGPTGAGQWRTTQAHLLGLLASLV